MEENDLKSLVKKYLDYLLYWYKHEGKFDPSIPEKYAEMIGKQETKLKKAGVTERQIEKLIEFAKQFHGLGEHETSEGMLGYVRQRLFSDR